MYFKLRKSQDVREKNLGRAQATKRSSMELSVTLEGKWDSIDGATIQRNRSPVFTSASALSRRILRRVMGEDSIHFSTDASNTELSFRIIHSSKSAQCLRSSLKLV